MFSYNCEILSFSYLFLCVFIYIYQQPALKFNAGC